MCLIIYTYVSHCVIIVSYCFNLESYIAYDHYTIYTNIHKFMYWIMKIYFTPYKCQDKIQEDCTLNLNLSTLLYTNLQTKLILLPHGVLSVLYWINIWCIPWTSPRSTRHSAVGLPLDIAHCPPLADKSDFFPSTARSAPPPSIVAKIILLPCRFVYCDVF